MTNQLTKTEAARYLCCSTRTLERAAANHSIQTTTRRNGSGRPEVVYEQADLDRLKSDRSTPVVNGTILDRLAEDQLALQEMLNRTPLQRQIDPVVEMISQVAERSRHLMNAPPAAQVSLADRLTLSLSEAAEYTGLTQNAINNAATRGKLKATLTRPRRYRPADLRAFVESL